MTMSPISPPPPPPPPHHHHQGPKPILPSNMAPKPTIFSDTLLFFSGAAVALLLFLSLSSFISPFPSSLLPTSATTATANPFFNPTLTHTSSHPKKPPMDPPPPNFYDDPTLSYTLDQAPIRNWDQKRQHWLSAHPSFSSPARERIVMVTGSQPGPCRNPIGDHLLLRFYKNKADYCRLHGIDLMYNTALLQPKMFFFWAKIPAIRSAMVAHPEAEWIWWVDSDAAFTDMHFSLPLERYQNYNLVLHGWPQRIYEAKSWTSINAGVLLIRNCQWSMDFIDRWAKMGPQSPEYAEWGRIQKSIFKDKLYPESDDQTGIAYMLLEEKEKWAGKVHLEYAFYFEGYWVEIMNRLERTEEMYLEIERKVEKLRRRRAEVDEVGTYGRMWEEVLEKEGMRAGYGGWRRPFVTHFTGCQPCSGDHNKMYSGENCFEGMKKALNFADNQVLRAYGFRLERLVNSTGAVRPLPPDFPLTA